MIIPKKSSKINNKNNRRKYKKKNDNICYYIDSNIISDSDIKSSNLYSIFEIEKEGFLLINKKLNDRINMYNIFENKPSNFMELKLSFWRKKNLTRH